MMAVTQRSGTVRGAKNKTGGPGSDYSGQVTFFLRSVLIIVLGSCFLAYFANCLGKYREGKVGVTVVEQTQNNFQYPTMVVCARVSDLEAARRPWIIHIMMEMQYSDDGGKTFFPRKRVIFPYNQTAPDYPEPLNARELWGGFISLIDNGTYTYTCDTFKPPSTAWGQYGVNNMFIVSLETEGFKMPYYMVGVDHDSTLNPVTFLERVALAPVPQLEVTNDSMPYIMTSMKLGELVSLGKDSKQPCLEDEDFAKQGSLMQCFFDYISLYAPCFWNGNINGCSAANIEKIQGLYFQLFEGGSTEFFDAIGCKLPCRRPTYEITLQSTIRGTPFGPPGSVLLILYVPESTKVVKSEFLIYDLAAFAGDVGGMVGVLLGASFLAIYDSLLKWVSKVMSLFRGN